MWFFTLGSVVLLWSYPLHSLFYLSAETYFFAYYSQKSFHTLSLPWGLSYIGWKSIVFLPNSMQHFGVVMSQSAPNKTMVVVMSRLHYLKSSNEQKCLVLDSKTGWGVVQAWWFSWHLPSVWWVCSQPLTAPHQWKSRAWFPLLRMNRNRKAVQQQVRGWAEVRGWEIRGLESS